MEINFDRYEVVEWGIYLKYGKMVNLFYCLRTENDRMIYSFNGKNINMNVCIQIRDVLKLLQQYFRIRFEEIALEFYKSETYKTLQETENGM